jgi:protein-disulfide isomerase
MPLALRVRAMAALVGAMLLLPLGAAAEEALSPAQEQAIEKLVHDYIMEHPEVILDSVRAMETRQQATGETEQQAAIIANKELLVNDPTAPVAGNPDGDITVVEFFDYRCPYCKSMAKAFITALEADGNVRIVFKEFPILGPESDFAAKAALAAARQGKYRDFHAALMEHKGQLGNDTVLSLAGDVGLDLDRLRKDMIDPAIAQSIRRNHELAGVLKISGTPAFIIGDRLIPGAMPMEEMLAIINAERKS